ncbi:Deoxynucleoside triphosphate triphosphohydrolase SAMHD1 [Symbiodinium microadriaticum]|uniref:Deoxynucleoside triphosphate triphosphohydrolase SAMHD1 n=1 Tax=Symbiodinium microadriaticum TaxID=2951 RepID=A0A1Q9DMR4_SYMMI|nr:Deoxynucleoside triphosphate triphosphohydrolase SAMHD1 [Symbiodinium microadriaticum]
MHADFDAGKDLTRDALFLGIGRQHDHNRYMKSVKVIFDEDGLKTISPPEKDKDHIRENILELRKTLHRFAYQHKTVKKLEQHMIDILMLFNKHATVTGTNKRRMSIAEAALEVDLVAYPKLTDMLVETRLLEAEEEGLKEACQLYQKTFIQRKLMRNVLIWWLPPAEEVAQRLPTTQQFLREMWELYDQSGPSRPSKDFARDEVRCVDAKLHCGMKQVDPIKKIVFHDKQGQPRLFEDHDANPLRQKFFVLWSPPDELEQTDVPQRLSMAAMGVASTYTTEPETTPVSPLRRKSRSGDLEASPPPSTPKVRLRQKRQLQVESSYPVNTEIFERKPA